jgi:hypothetical protein
LEERIMEFDMKKNLIVFISVSILLLFVIAGCALPDSTSAGQGESTTLNTEPAVRAATSARDTGIWRRYTPRGSILPYWNGTPNCTAFAWQNIKIPISVPDYGFINAQPFLDDGSYYKLPSTETPKAGDRVVYGDWWHSAVVYSVTGKNVTVISYWIRDIDPVTQRPNIRYLPVDAWGMPYSYYRVSDERYWNTPNCLSRKVAFQAVRNGMYVCADLNYSSDGPLYSNRTWIQEWETFYLVKAEGQYVNIWSQATCNYVKAYATSRANAKSGPSYHDDYTFLVFEWGETTFISWPANGKMLRYDSFKPEGVLYTDNAFYMKDM